MHSRGTTLSPLPAVSQGGSSNHHFILKPVLRVKIRKSNLKVSWELRQSNLTILMEVVVSSNSTDSWAKLLHFSACYLRVPSKDSHCLSLATMINN